MKIGIHTVVCAHLGLDEVLRRVSEVGFEAVEIPAHKNNGLLDIEEVVKGNNAICLEF